MRYPYVLLICLLVGAGCRFNTASLPQTLDLNQPRFETYTEFEAVLDAIEDADPPRQDSLLNAFWTGLRQTEQIPFALGDQVAFLYRGAAKEVQWHGDFDGWGGKDNLMQSSKGERLDGTDLWVLEMTLPADARIDYKLVVDETWLLDPNNPQTILSGFGENSELRMPAYTPEPAIERNPAVPQGTLHPAQGLSSTALGYTLQFRVYTPAGYDVLDAHPSLYVTDGQEYAREDGSGLPVVLDNLIAAGEIMPLVAVFIDARDPDDLEKNRREDEFLMNPAYAQFIAEELVPFIDATYATAGVAESRGIMGTSYGGMNGAYLVLQHPETFHLAGLQSPAFWPDDAIYEQHKAATLPLKVFMSTGTISDVQDQARKMKRIFEAKGYPMQYMEVNEGHSWGAWLAQLDDLLRFLYPAT